MVVGAAAGPIVPSRLVLSGYILKYLGIDTQVLISGVDDPGMTCTATLLQGFGFQTPAVHGVLGLMVHGGPCQRFRGQQNSPQQRVLLYY